MYTPLQQGELYAHDTLSSCAYFAAMRMACPLFMPFIITRLQSPWQLGLSLASQS